MRHLLLAVVLLASTEAPAPAPGPFMITISVQPSSEGEYRLLRRAAPNTYFCQVLVSDPASRTVGSARIVAETGKLEMVTTTYEDYSLLFSVKIDPQPRANRAETLVLIRRDYKIVAQQQSTIALLPTAPRYLPLDQ
jgi:hypothetical protein